MFLQLDPVEIVDHFVLEVFFLLVGNFEGSCPFSSPLGHSEHLLSLLNLLANCRMELAVLLLQFLKVRL